MSNYILKYHRGFTLIELLVVVAIIAILATVTTLQYAGLNKKARDSARRADIYEIATAFEVNKRPEGYQSLQSSQFISFQWQDPLGNAYCVASSNLPDPSQSSNWGNSCPSGFIVIGPGLPAGTFPSWKACTYLEKPAEGQANIFCRSSTQ